MVSVLSAWLMVVRVFLPLVGEHLNAAAPHPFYVSVAEINQNAAEKSLEISCKFFADDFEHTLEKAYNTKLDINNEKEKPAFDKYIADYVSRHLRLSADGKGLALKYVGYEKEREAVYAYFEVVNVAAIKRLDIVNDLLYDYTEEQINIVHATVGGKRQSGKVSYPDAKVSFSY